jgi:hypothetical protein
MGRTHVPKIGRGKGRVRIAERHLRMKLSHGISSHWTSHVDCRVCIFGHEKKRDVVKLGTGSDKLCDELRSPCS